MMFIIKNLDKYQTDDSFIAKLWDKKTNFMYNQ
jgi:hypothetical protein